MNCSCGRRRLMLAAWQISVSSREAHTLPCRAISHGASLARHRAKVGMFAVLPLAFVLTFGFGPQLVHRLVALALPNAFNLSTFMFRGPSHARWQLHAEERLHAEMQTTRRCRARREVCNGGTFNATRETA